jgi:hypothetical protein
MSPQQLTEQKQSETDRKNTEILERLLSERQLRANRENAQKSTGPRTGEGKQRSRLNGVRHGITRQVSIMTDENRAAHDAFCNPIIDSLAPEGPLEMQLANLIAQDHWRLNRIQPLKTDSSCSDSAAPSTRSIRAPRRQTSRSPKP